MHVLSPIRSLLLIALLTTSVPAAANPDIVVGPLPNKAAKNKTLDDTILPNYRQRFAEALNVQASPAKYGQWSSTGEQAVWRANIRAEDANSVSLKLDNLKLPKGAELRFGSADNQMIHGPYLPKDIGANGLFWTPTVAGNDAWLELTLPLDAYQREDYSLNISKVNSGYIEFWKENSFEKMSGSCQVDVICDEGNGWRDQIRSVARLVIDGQFLCTGSLVNNTRSNGRPLILSAVHCVDIEASNDIPNPPSYQEAVQSIVAYWNYESNSCGQRQSFIQLAPNQTGASPLMAYKDSDTLLFQLNTLPPSNANTYWSGWDNRNVTPSNVTTIHHPSGDVKSISVDFDSTRKTFPGQSNFSSNGTYLRVADWDVGSTEGGSSGGGLWDSNRRIVGTLLGGFAACGNNDADWYGRVHSAWSNNDCRDSLEYWLDPANSNSGVIDGLNYTGGTASYRSCSVPVRNPGAAPPSGGGSGGSGDDDDDDNSGSSGGGGGGSSAAPWALALLLLSMYLRFRRSTQHLSN